jgi:hypothetical protein
MGLRRFDPGLEAIFDIFKKKTTIGSRMDWNLNPGWPNATKTCVGINGL